MFWLLSLVWASPWDADEGQMASQLLRLHDQEKWAELSPKVRTYVKRYPNSFTGNYVFGRALWLGHAEHARALHHLEVAESIYRKEYEMKSEPPWKLFSKLLFSLQSIAGDMGENEKELEYIKDYNDEQDIFQDRFEESYYKLIGERGWPLMKLGRYDEARMAAQEALETGREWQQSLAYNVLCAVEAEEGNREAAQENCIAALEHARTDSLSIAIDASNASNASFSVLDFERVEEFGIEGTESAGDAYHAWMNLVRLYIIQGKGAAALSAMKGLRSSHAAEEPHRRSQSRSDIDALFSMILLLAGEDEKALTTIDRVLRSPDRRGSISFSKEQTLGGHMALRYMIRKMSMERKRERDSVHGVMGYMNRMLDAIVPDPRLLADATAVRSVLLDENCLVYTFRMYQDQGLVEVYPFLMGSIIEILGPGISKVALDKVRSQEEFGPMTSYFDALEVDIAYQQGDWAKVEVMAQTALESLPLDEALLIARMNAFLGKAQERKSAIELSMQYYTEAFNKDPSVFRRLEWSLPASIRVQGGGIQSSVGDALGRSPRFHYHKKGFVIDIQDGAICLLSGMGAQLSCVPFPERTRIELVEKEGAEPEEKEITLDDDEYTFEIVDAFHLGVFGLSNGDTGVDWNSLDGSTTTSRHSTHKKLKEMLK